MLLKENIIEKEIAIIFNDDKIMKKIKIDENRYISINKLDDK